MCFTSLYNRNDNNGYLLVLWGRINELMKGKFFTRVHGKYKAHSKSKQVLLLSPGRSECISYLYKHIIPWILKLHLKVKFFNNLQARKGYFPENLTQCYTDQFCKVGFLLKLYFSLTNRLIEFINCGWIWIFHWLFLLYWEEKRIFLAKKKITFRIFKEKEKKQ